MAQPSAPGPSLATALTTVRSGPILIKIIVSIGVISNPDLSPPSTPSIGEAPMELGQVEAFLAVNTFGGFRRAADALRLTQPAVSARIRALEDSLGVSLFERGQGLALSAAGRALRPHAEQLLRAAALARQAVHDLQPAAGGAVQIAAALSI